jgi:hypothetical protein
MTHLCPTDTPFVTATKRHLPAARIAMAAAYPNAAPHLLDALTLAHAQLSAADDVSGRTARTASMPERINPPIRKAA